MEGCRVWGYPNGTIHHIMRVECATCHLEGMHIPWMAAISIPLLWTMLKGMQDDAHQPVGCPDVGYIAPSAGCAYPVYGVLSTP